MDSCFITRSHVFSSSTVLLILAHPSSILNKAVCFDNRQKYGKRGECSCVKPTHILVDDCLGV